METLEFILNKCTERPKGDYRHIEIPNAGRDDLAKWLHELDFKRGAEIGVANGIYSELLLKENPQMLLYGVDPWRPYSGYRDYTRTGTFKRLYDEMIVRTSPFPNYQIIQEFSMDALSHFEDDSLDFVYIDANHSEPYVSQDINGWYKKVRPGGILAGHDYAKIKGYIEGVLTDTNWAVKGAINKFAQENKIDNWFVIGREAKEPGVKREKVRSWMLVK